MGKVKQKQAASGKASAHKHIDDRVNFLYDAARYLANAQRGAERPVQQEQKDCSEDVFDPKTAQLLAGSGQTRHLVSQMRDVAMKGRGKVRMPVDIKRSICKRCSTLLQEGRTCATALQNESKDASKPWADVNVVTCLACGGKKRYPVGIARQAHKKDRVSKQTKGALQAE